MALKCFIAMAFEREDTDKLYDKTIEPLLKRKGISQFRVDRSNRNDDIDDQILSELRKCDFVIADLTYARPSVYFEAGIAQGRPVPVIYTCRRDHFKHQPDDEHGNFCVHFDLQMKPIIPWSDPPSVAFSRQLEKRIALVVRPLLSKQQISEAEERERLRFAAYSVSEKLERLKELYQATVRSRGFPNYSGWFDWQRKKNTTVLIESFFTNSLTKKDFDAFFGYYYYFGTRKRTIQEYFMSKRLPKTIERHVFLCSIRNVTESRVTAALSRFKVTKTIDEIQATCDMMFSFERKKKAHRVSEVWVAPGTIELPLKIYAHFISDISSEDPFKNRVENIMKSIGRTISHRGVDNRQTTTFNTK